MIKTVNIAEGLDSICITYQEEEYIYIFDKNDDTISPLIDFSKLGDRGLRIICEDAEYEVEFDWNTITTI